MTTAVRKTILSLHTQALVGGSKQQHADAPNPLALLSAHSERPRGYTAAEKRDELAPF